MITAKAAFFTSMLVVVAAYERGVNDVVRSKFFSGTVGFPHATRVAFIK